MATLGLIRSVYEWDWKGAEKALSTAINLNPGSPKSHYDYVLYLAVLVRNIDKATSEDRKAIELDPLSGIAHYIFGIILLTSGQYDQAIEILRYVREMIPKHLGPIRNLGWAYREEGMLEEAMDEIKKGLGLFPKNPMLLERLGHICAVKGEKKKTRAILNELLQRSKKEYVFPVYITLLYADLGQLDQPFEYLKKGFENQDIWLSYIAILITWAHILHPDPRFPAFLKKLD